MDCGTHLWSSAILPTALKSEETFPSATVSQALVPESAAQSNSTLMRTSFRTPVILNFLLIRERNRKTQCSRIQNGPLNLKKKTLPAICQKSTWKVSSENYSSLAVACLQCMHPKTVSKHFICFKDFKPQQDVFDGSHSCVSAQVNCLSWF